MVEMRMSKECVRALYDVGVDLGSLEVALRFNLPIENLDILFREAALGESLLRLSDACNIPIDPSAVYAIQDYIRAGDYVSANYIVRDLMQRIFAYIEG